MGEEALYQSLKKIAVHILFGRKTGIFTWLDISGGN
jgi:hypothetical protein